MTDQAPPLRRLELDGAIALLEPRDTPDPDAYSAAAAELAADPEAEILIGAVQTASGRTVQPPEPPFGADRLLAAVRIPAASLVISLAASTLPADPVELETRSAGAAVLALLHGARVSTSGRVLGRIGTDPAGEWWTDEREMEELAELARSQAARDSGMTRALRRELLARALNERPILGQPWEIPEMLGPDPTREELSEWNSDLRWTLERQADSLLAASREWEKQPISPSPETGELLDTELLRRDREIAQLREADMVLREQLAGVQAQLRRSQEARQRDARELNQLRQRPEGPEAALGGRAAQLWRLLVPQRVRRGVWRIAPLRAAALRRRSAEKQGPGGR